MYAVLGIWRLTENHWNHHHRIWSRLGPPLRPAPEALRALERELNADGEHVLLLGVTSELNQLGASMTATELSPAVIAARWPGDTETRRALEADWMALPLADSSVGRVAGDGSLSCVAGRAERLKVLSEAARVMRPGGRGAIRLFAGTDEAENLDQVIEDAMAGAIGSFHALKWRVAMAHVSWDADRGIAVSRIREAFNAMFPDRAELSAAAGWHPAVIDTIDAYEKSDVVYSFPSQRLLREEAGRSFGSVRFVETGHYPLAERCPLLVLGEPLKG